MSFGLRAGVANDGYLTINGLDVVQITTSGIVSVPTAINQCRFQYTSSTVCTLIPFNGNMITINGSNFVVPSAGVTIAPTGLTVSTLYYIYAWMNSTTMTLEASTTGHSTSTNGVEIKTGDATRTLVGAVYIVAGPLFQDTVSARYVMSWYNKKTKLSTIALTANISTASASLAEIDVTYRAFFLAWTGDNITSYCTGGMFCSSPATVQAALFITGAAATGNFDGGCITTIPTASYYSTLACTANLAALTDGQNYVGLKGATAAGSLTITGSAIPGVRSTIQVLFQG